MPVNCWGAVGCLQRIWATQTLMQVAGVSSGILVRCPVHSYVQEGLVQEGHIGTAAQWHLCGFAGTAHPALSRPHAVMYTEGWWAALSPCNATQSHACGLHPAAETGQQQAKYRVLDLCGPGGCSRTDSVCTHRSKQRAVRVQAV